MTPSLRGVVTGLAWMAAACTPPARSAETALFELLSPRTTGVRFENVLADDPDFNILTYLYYYNGGGVAVGDVDGDGLQDLYFTANTGPNRLYRNRGDFRFEDITDRAGVAGSGGWTTGVTMADVNGDGRIDIYVSGVRYLSKHGRNVLYINAGDGRFRDETDRYGLGQDGYGTQALFFDYDGDGDLDAYLLNHATHTERGIGTVAGASDPDAAADRLMRNDGTRFHDVSVQAGLVRGLDGFGLGVVASDLNSDGCPDLYVANDFQENDLLYVNRCDGTFEERITTATGHTSRFSMGVDAADIDNDGLVDIFVGDMLPEREDVLKTSASAETFTLFNLRLRAGYHPQYARNTLQLNRGDLRFSEIGYLAGVHATDWTWAPLFADLDNDGRKDLFVANGIYRRPNDLDYINYVGNEAAQSALRDGDAEKRRAIIRRMPQVPLANHAFRNQGDLTFASVAAEWGLTEAGFSTGAAYVDLDNDGALDLVVNDVNGPARIYRNRGAERNAHAWLTVRLDGAGANTAGLGSRVYVYAGGVSQLAEQMPTRGFQSSVDPRLHFGLGRATRADSIVVVWPDLSFQVLRDVALNQTLVVAQGAASGRWSRTMAEGASTPPLFTDQTSRAQLAFDHIENGFLDTDREPLMPHLLSAEGPALAVGDVNGDGLDDMFVGGGKWQASRLLIQGRGGTFSDRGSMPFAVDSIDEDVDAAFFDADGDGDLDLYVVTAGNEFWGDADALRDRLYFNDGHGALRKAPEGALPRITEHGARVAPGDFDGDGDVDLFVGSRVVSRSYGLAPPSHLLRNDGRGWFTDVTAKVAPELARLGMVSDAVWVTHRGAAVPELVIVGEWMGVRLFAMHRDRLVDRTVAAGFSGTEGWWNSVTAADLNGDGVEDLILGNLGLNAYMKASESRPVQMRVHDFGSTGVQKQILEFYRGDTSYPVAGRDDLVRLIPTLRSRYPQYASFGASTVNEIFSADELRAATTLTARTFASMVAMRDAGGRFSLEELPIEAQFAPVYASLADDFDGDGLTDILLGGNQHGVPPVLGRYDASRGLVLRGHGDGQFSAVHSRRSGIDVEGQIRALARLRHSTGWAVIVARNNAGLQLLRADRRHTARGGRPTE